ncbi:hypothetical protein [Luteimonas sp. 3794]|uniref:hypothetical protein n=1 Tax=Luteimonas sp. 3794 TaxID=2817730 RepID=UPI00285BA975|nr:hypothetical protein [Luteimonas sp. 3794]MDR6989929.1 hypothetical protein [Luteimonas sp. 3794]
MTTYTLQYDMGLRFWVLTDPQGQTVATYLSRATALRDEVVRNVLERGCILRIRNADGTYEPSDAPAPPRTDAAALAAVSMRAADSVAA